MPEQFGWCVPCRVDSPSTPARCCAVCGYVLIPPSWSSKGVAYPWPERPEGWSWAPPVDGEVPVRPADKPHRPMAASRKPAPKKQATAQVKKSKPFTPSPAGPAPAKRRVRQSVVIVCVHCKQEAPSYTHGGAPQRYCSAVCRHAAQVQRKSAKRAARHLILRQQTRSCARCHADFTPEIRGGTTQRYCSIECRHQTNNHVRSTRPMSERGMVCADCGRDDRPHRAHGLCGACWKRSRRVRKEQAQEVAA